MKWLSDFKRALIEEDFDTVSKLVDKMPIFTGLKEQKEALHLINEAKKVVKEQKDETLKQMQQIQKTKKFVDQTDGVYSFDMSY